MAAIQNLLHFRGQALSQFLLVATILGAFSMSGVVAMIAAHEKLRLRSIVFVLLTLASLAFVAATIVAVLILPFMDERAHVSDMAAKGILRLYSLVLGAIVLGTCALLAGLGAAGFMVSRRVGVWVCAATAACVFCLAVCCWYLASVLR